MRRTAFIGGRWMRLAFFACAAFVVAELVSLAVASWQHGGLCGYTCHGEARRRAVESWLAESARPTAESEENEEQRPRWVNGMLNDQAVHPFLGFVDNPKTYDPENHDYYGKIHEEAKTYGFLANIHPIFHEPRDDRLIVVILGGSVARQISSRGREGLEKALAEIPRFAGKEVQVISLAVGGYKAPQPLFSLIYFLSLGLHVDVAITVDGLNDIALGAKDNIPFGVHPHYPRSWGYRVSATSDPDSMTLGEIRLLGHQRRRAAEVAGKFPFRYSLTANTLWRFADRRVGTWIDSRQATIGVGIDAEEFFMTGPPFEELSLEEYAKDSVALWERSALLLHELTENHGIESYQFIQPNQYDGQKPLLEFELRQAYDPDSPFRKRVETAFPMLRERGAILRQQGVRLHDMTDVFAGVREPLYFDFCCHVNERGVELMVERIVSQVAAARL